LVCVRVVVAVGWLQVGGATSQQLQLHATHTKTC
jgi:hypothetical protein